MAQVHLQVPSFNAGELSPLLGARFAVEKVASGCRKLRNFIPHVHGPAFRRPGMEDIGPSAGVGAKSNLRGFNFSVTTGFVLEFHPEGLQVWSNGFQVPLENPVDLPYSEAECAEVQMAQVNDVCYLAHGSHAPRRLVRAADTKWKLEDVEWVWPALGDENVRPEEITTPGVVTLLEVPTYEWPEFRQGILTGSTAYNFSVIDPDLSGTAKVAKLYQVNSGGTWVLRETISWTTVAPGAHAGTVASELPWRMTYSGPIGASGSKLHLTLNGGGHDLPIDVIQPAEAETVVVAAGEWQATVECPSTVPAGAKLTVQRLSGSTWVNVKQLTLTAGAITVYRGATLPTARTMRFQWSGREMSGGTAKLEQLTFVTSASVTLAVSDVIGPDRTMTASAPLFQAGHVGSFWQITHRRDTSFAQIVSAEPTIAADTSATIRVSGHWDVYSYGTWSATLYLEKKVSGDWEVLRSWSSRKDRNIIASGEEADEVEMRLRVSAGTSEAATGAAVPRFVLEASDARVNGLVKITAVGTLNSDGKATTATVDVLTTLHSTDATSLWTEGAWSGVNGYPRAVALHGGRAWFGGTNAEPLRVWGSVVNDYENFRRSSLDDASVSFVPAAQQANALQWMASHGVDLVLGTTGDEWTISGGVDNGPITPTSVQVQRRSGYGSNYRQSLILGEVLVFIQRGGRKIREVAPRPEGGIWSASDLTVLSEHVTLSGLVQIAAMNFPSTILWGVTQDGKLLGMTFEQEQNVFAWHVHETDGFVESVAVVFGVESDEVWLAVRRNGQRRIERLDPAVFARTFDSPARLMYLDAARRFEFEAPSSTLTGLEHLNGRQVQVLGDGATMLPVAVVDGVVTLEREISTAIVGLPFTSLLQPMRIEIPLRDGTAQGRNFRITRADLTVHDSLGGEIADAADGRFEKLDYRTVSTPMDSAPSLLTGEIETALESTVRAGFDVVIRQTDPLPLNISSIIIKGDVYGD
jgi:hypothetical protein